jgi:hypothetical protein
MTNEEHRQIRAALAGWFESQSVSLSDAATVMGTLIAEITAEISDSDCDMDEGIRSFFKNVAEKIKNNKYRRAR